ncbi:MAG: aminoacyl-tRNA hydrolase [Candidatus Colwellbacteria bacterium]|jgi:PTH1 family peptidyl-tRNA hydrolase|nr:aminoacyl-tRNA hydrolase [Candidatus Colwellbacteria bacterium]MCK9497714.1 aminoacyl-tRNA hydrolase [Candidatus Colwellbacteria bacterium]MDD3752690.1 aminoacyl-tRNA hydrolase [Candidatus Colwellbacteria bacterium]MDD4818839.1 aminoacyl-tRNA hydrolase [Candidatus Colwellbacteria bacterium]
MEKQNWKLIIGLGNPGSKYKDTYHNIGAEALARLAGKEGFKKPFSIWRGKPFEYAACGEKTFIRPTVFMNESGKAVAAAMKHFGASPEEILVIHDDSDIDAGNYKADIGRGSAGHNGVKSIIEHLGTENFWRLRIGVRGEKKGKAGDFVLKKISPADRDLLNKALSEIEIHYSE